MTNTVLTLLIIVLVLLVLISAFFSSAETGMMAINRYRLRHMVRDKNPAAMRVSKLLERTDRLLSVILIGNTFANIFASAIGTIIAVHFLGEIGIAVATVLLTLIILIFGEISPKTVASIFPQKVAFFAVYPLMILLKLLYPVVVLANFIANGFLRLLGINLKQHKAVDRLSREELRTVVMESTGRISPQHHEMLLRVLDSEKITVDDIMIPRNEINGIDINEEWDKILKRLTMARHTRLPLYEDEIDNVKGIANLRKIMPLLAKGTIDKEKLLHLSEEPYYIPEGTPLTTQMLNFRKESQRYALVVDEYGDIQGLVTIADIIEEIVGEITTETPSISKLVIPENGCYIVDGSVNIRELNRLLQWYLPTNGPKTLSGLIIEYLETIPVPHTCVLLNNYPIEITEVKDNMVKSVKISPQLPYSTEVE